MRDIRGDLQDRASLLEDQINAHEAEFELIEQLKREHDSRLQDLKAELEAVTRLMEVELRRLSSAPAAPTVQTREPVHHAVHQPAQQSAHQPPQHSAHQPPQQSAHQPPQHPAHQPLQHSVHQPPQHPVHQPPQHSAHQLALQDDYFADSDTADRGMHNTLLNVVKAGLIRQLPNGNFAPATIRLRRAM